MRIIIPTTGSRGDVQPYVALGVGLQAGGHKVRLVTHADFEPFVRGRGLEFHAIEDNGQSLQGSRTGNKMVHAGGNTLVFLRNFGRLRKPLMRNLMANCFAAAKDADVILVASTAFFEGYAAAEKLGIPAFSAYVQPLTPTRFLTNCLCPRLPGWLDVAGLYSLLSYYLPGQFLWQMLRQAVNEARQEVLGLPPLGFFGPPPRMFCDWPTLYGYSSAVIPRPRDWSANNHITGYWFLDSPTDWQPPAALVDFLNAGPPPVYIGFGSMHNRDAEQVTSLVVEALRRARQRGVLVTGWGGMAERPNTEDVFLTESVSHDWLFPRTVAVVHHGGAGTTAAALRAGKPSLVIPFMADQPFWGRRVQALGAGPQPIPRKKLSARRLAAGIEQAVADLGMKHRAALLGRRLCAENGVSNAVEILEKHFLGSPGILPRRVA